MHSVAIHRLRAAKRQIGYFPAANLKTLWLVGLFDIVGGPPIFFFTLLRTLIAEAVPSASLSVFEVNESQNWTLG